MNARYDEVDERLADGGVGVRFGGGPYVRSEKGWVRVLAGGLKIMLGGL